eukprot:8700354-Alexandrium_andersonii.AAC.1
MRAVQAIPVPSPDVSRRTFGATVHGRQASERASSNTAIGETGCSVGHGADTTSAKPVAVSCSRLTSRGEP